MVEQHGPENKRINQGLQTDWSGGTSLRNSQNGYQTPTGSQLGDTGTDLLFVF